MSKVVFVDFDGTISKTDTCDAMVKAFASDGWEDICRLWEQKKITTVECANKLFELFNTDLEALGSFLDSIEIDGYFKEFLSLCRSRGYKVYILSDGYDFNISRILQNHGIEVPFYSNRLLYEEGFRIQTPYHNIACGQCGTCKTNLLSGLKESGDTVIYIGDGYSDTCAAQKSDRIFAKGSLFKFCTAKNIEATRFDSFKDIIDILF